MFEFQPDAVHPEVVARSKEMLLDIDIAKVQAVGPAAITFYVWVRYTLVSHFHFTRFRTDKEIQCCVSSISLVHSATHSFHACLSSSRDCRYKHRAMQRLIFAHDFWRCRGGRSTVGQDVQTPSHNQSEL